MLDFDCMTLDVAHKDLELYVGDNLVIKHVPYSPLTSCYYAMETDFPLAVAFIDGAWFLCFETESCLRLCSGWNNSFSDSPDYAKELDFNAERT